MKRQAIALADLADRNNLLLATWKAARGKHQRSSVQAFLTGLDDRLHALGQSILTGAAPLGLTRQFEIRDPKRRTITAACFEDRVLHHAIINLAGPRFERALAPGVFACRAGAGVHAAVAAVQRALRQQAWLVQVDVNAFFPTIDHAVLRQQVAAQFKGAEFLALLSRIIDAGAVASGRGLPIGALTRSTLPMATSARLIACWRVLRVSARPSATWMTWCGSAARAAWPMKAWRPCAHCCTKD